VSTLNDDLKIIDAIGAAIDRDKHTSGPWIVSPPTAENPSRARVSALSGFVDIYDAPLTTETAANARLIASAPDLLASLKAMTTLMQNAAAEIDINSLRGYGGRTVWENVHHAKAVIAKAEEEQ